MECVGMHACMKLSWCEVQLVLIGTSVIQPKSSRVKPPPPPPLYWDMRGRNERRTRRGKVDVNCEVMYSLLEIVAQAGNRHHHRCLYEHEHIVNQCIFLFLQGYIRMKMTMISHRMAKQVYRKILKHTTCVYLSSFHFSVYSLLT